MPTRWIITRAVEDSGPLVAQLNARGVPAMAVPCIEREQLRWPQWELGPDDDAERLLFLTSLAAAHGAVSWCQQPSARRAYVAAMPQAAAHLKEHGVPVDVVSEGGAVALAGAVKAWWRGGGSLRVLYPSSDVGEQQPEQHEAVALMGHFAQVDRACVYLTKMPPELPTRLASLPPEPARWLFASPSAVVNLWATPSAASVAPAVDVLCLGASTLRTWHSRRHHTWPQGRLYDKRAPLIDALTLPP